MLAPSTFADALADYEEHAAPIAERRGPEQPQRDTEFGNVPALDDHKPPSFRLHGARSICLSVSSGATPPRLWSVDEVARLTCTAIRVDEAELEAWLIYKRRTQ